MSRPGSIGICPCLRLAVGNASTASLLALGGSSASLNCLPTDLASGDAWRGSAWPQATLAILDLPLPPLGSCSTRATISFTYTLGSYEVALLLGRAYPEPLPVMAIRLFTSVDLATRPQAAAAAIVTAVLALLAVAGALMMLRRSAVWR